MIYVNTNLSLAIKLTLYTVKNPEMYKDNFLEKQFTIGMMLLSVQQMFSIPDLWSYGFRMAVPDSVACKWNILFSKV